MLTFNVSILDGRPFIEEGELTTDNCLFTVEYDYLNDECKILKRQQNIPNRFKKKLYASVLEGEREISYDTDYEQHLESNSPDNEIRKDYLFSLVVDLEKETAEVWDATKDMLASIQEAAWQRQHETSYY